MPKLQEQKCAPCSGDVSPATEEEINTYKKEVPDWNIVTENGESHLQKVYKFPNFKAALAFTNSVGDLAEEEGHHPVLVTEWGKVTVTWWTHAINALHQNDFIMAAKSDEVANSSS